MSTSVPFFSSAFAPPSPTQAQLKPGGAARGPRQPSPSPNERFARAAMRNRFVSTAIGGAAGSVFSYAKSLTDGAIAAQLDLKPLTVAESSLNNSVDVDPAIARSAHL